MERNWIFFSDFSHKAAFFLVFLILFGVEKEKTCLNMTEHENTACRIQVYYRIVMFGLHWWAFQQRSCREIRDWWKVSELSTIPAIYTSFLLISGGRALLGKFACVEAANGRIRRQPFSLSFSYGRHLSFPTCGHWELRSLWLMLLSMRHDPLYPYEASLKQFTSFFQLGLDSVCMLSQPLEI